ncbi:LysR family transcriptional regulator [Novosphingobium umbonatum]|uniref:LysR family transcriptional regulator n=1 Tax=Novosphingobium umbonatum TaxID=1908524 RepID=UPI0013E33022|nr:LysR family transcriptional regulator [Novosphingobium umbonatum]
MPKAGSDLASETTRIDLNLLLVFDMVMIERHVTRASIRLGLTQSAVSNALNRLRALFDDMLFVKAARGVEPTQRALVLWPEIHAALTQLQRSVRPGLFDPATSTIDFRISMVDLSAALLTPNLYRCIHEDAPGVSLSFVPHNPELTAERLVRGEVDFAISIEPPRMTVLEAIPLWSEGYVIAARKGHPMLDHPLSIDELCSLPQLHINLSGSPSSVSPVDAALQELGKSRPIKLVVNQFLVATTMLRESDLLAVLPMRLVADGFRQNWITFQPLPIALPEAALHLVWHKRNNGLQAMAWLKRKILDATTMLNADIKARIGG